MTPSEIKQYLNKNIVYTHFNEISMWSDWQYFLPENKEILIQIDRESDFIIEFRGNTYRLKIYFCDLKK